MGAQDSLGQALDFLEVTGVATPTMVWDPGFDSWTYYGVSGQPTIILVDPSGNPIRIEVWDRKTTPKPTDKAWIVAPPWCDL